MEITEFKCPCGCRFFSRHDYSLHVKTHWRPTKRGDGDTIQAKYKPVLAARIATIGTLIEAGYRYCLVGREKLIWRTRERNLY